MSVHAVVLPGGGYRTHAPHEAEPVVDWLEGLGIPAAVFRYPLGRAHPVAHDAIGAHVAALRARGADRVLLVGFSAGGHAAGMAALAPTGAAARIDGVILGYPVVSLREHVHQDSARVLLAERADAGTRADLSLDALVSRDAPPFFVFHSLDDRKVPVDHALLLSAALRGRDVPHELHLYADGGHGAGVHDDRVSWRGPAEAWLEREGWIRG
ncbi:alpha/beta hydrolase [Microbacterium sp. NPDC055683]